MLVTRNTLTSTFVKTNGLSLHVIQAGSADGVLTLLLHGFPEFWYGWRHQIDPLADLGLRLWIPDQRGYNHSDKPQGIASYRVEALAQDVVGLIHAAGATSANIIGHDWGGLVAWSVALRHPAFVRKLAILNVPHPQVLEQTLRSDLTQLMRSLYAGFFQLPLLPEALMQVNGWQPLLNAIKSTANPGSFTPEDLERYREAWSQSGAMTAMLNWYRAAVRYTPAKVPNARITIPTLMIWGERDVALKSTMAQHSIELCENGRLVMLPQATHWVQHDEAERVHALMAEFLMA